MTRRLDVSVDRSTCIGSGMCTGTAPELFELDAAHRSRPRVPTVDDQSPVWEAAESCPVEAITLHDAATHQELFPAD